MRSLSFGRCEGRGIASALGPHGIGPPLSYLLMGGLGFRGVIKEQHTFVRTRNRTGFRHSLATADDAGNRCGMMRIAVGRSSDQFVSKIESSKRVDR
jgi:hypothetical protein